MITAKEARIKIIRELKEDKELEELINRINGEIEYGINRHWFSTTIFINHLLENPIKGALKVYYTALGYGFEYEEGCVTCNIEIDWV